MVKDIKIPNKYFEAFLANLLCCEYSTRLYNNHKISWSRIFKSAKKLKLKFSTSKSSLAHTSIHTVCYSRQPESTIDESTHVYKKMRKRMGMKNKVTLIFSYTYICCCCAARMASYFFQFLRSHARAIWICLCLYVCAKEIFLSIPIAREREF